MFTGQACTHAMHDVHCQSVSCAITWSMSGCRSIGAPSTLWPDWAKRSRATSACFPCGVFPLAWYLRSTMKSRGFSSLPVAYAGHAS